MGRRGKRKVLSIAYICNGIEITYICTSNNEFKKTRKENMEKIMENKKLGNSKKIFQEIDANDQNLFEGNINRSFFDINNDEEYDNLNKFFDDEDDNYDWTFNHSDNFFL